MLPCLPLNSGYSINDVRVFYCTECWEEEECLRKSIQIDTTFGRFLDLRVEKKKKTMRKAQQI